MEEILHQLRLVLDPIIYDGFYTFQVVGNGIFEPSTIPIKVGPEPIVGV